MIDKWLSVGENGILIAIGLRSGKFIHHRGDVESVPHLGMASVIHRAELYAKHGKVSCA